MLELGSYPTPVAELTSLSSPGSALWIKRDDQTSPIYGGNKLRKLERLLDHARQTGARRIVTLGAVGSHHVLATGIFGAALGLRVEAVLLPRPDSPGVLTTLRATIAQGVALFPAESYAEARLRLQAWAAEGAYVIPAGGTNRLGTLGIMDAAAELALQVQAGALPEPDLIVVPLGSGGTVAGLLAGLAQTELRSRVLAVTVAEPAKLFEQRARSLAKSLVSGAARERVLERLQIERRYLGAGYGVTSAESAHACAEAARVGITLDTTYTGKAFAAALAHVALGRARTILYWQTLSSAPLTPLLRDAPLERELEPRLRGLIR
jgi:1-aminocyclopropane-1-carboxylate deaminase/D-cysteine desulfhydrase-like pyridoxal-dependent ACC family enzyme